MTPKYKSYKFPSGKIMTYDENDIRVRELEGKGAEEKLKAMGIEIEEAPPCD